jgi:hypothetical protein
MAHDALAANAVLVGPDMPVRSLTQLWLTTNGIVQPDEFESGCLFADSAVAVNATHFQLQAIADRLQLAIKAPGDDRAGPLVMKLADIASRFPYLPYTAIGLNYIWRVVPTGQPFGAFVRELFSHPGTPLYRQFDSEDARFGAYLSKQTIGFRLRLDIKPAHAEEGMEFLLLNFNFNRDFAGGDAMEQIRTALASWADAYGIAHGIVKTLQEGTGDDG